MDTITVAVGTVSSNRDGVGVLDRRREVQFEGERLGYMHDGSDDTRPYREELYRAADGRLVAYVKAESNWQGETSHYTLHQVTEADLQPGGRFQWLGQECGFGRPLTLDEALAPPEPTDYAFDDPGK